MKKIIFILMSFCLVGCAMTEAEENCHSYDGNVQVIKYNKKKSTIDYSEYHYDDFIKCTGYYKS